MSKYLGDFVAKVQLTLKDERRLRWRGPDATTMADRLATTVPISSDVEGHVAWLDPKPEVLDPESREG